MTNKALFAGLVIDELDRPVDVVTIGDEPCYVVDDAGFRRHIPSEQVDRQVLQSMKESITGHEDIITDQTAKMTGQDDIFSRAMIGAQIKNMDKHFDNLLETGIPEDGRTFLGMMGFRIRINVHGEVIEVLQPGIAESDGEDE